MHTPRKRFGQNFLCDQQVVSHIVASLAPGKMDHLVEIGPGQGALTLPVLKKVKTLEVVELDRDLIPALKERAGSQGDLIIHQADALKFNFASLKTDDRPLRVFGNLPYNISTPLLFHLLTFTNLISDMMFMLQKEVAERIAAPVNSDHYGRLSVMVQYHCTTELLFIVPPEAFYPAPKVQSSIIKLTPHKVLPFVANNYATFESVVKHAFEMRRKTLRNSLKKLIDDALWEKIGINPQSRAENLSVEEFVKISNYL